MNIEAKSDTRLQAQVDGYSVSYLGLQQWHTFEDLHEVGIPRDISENPTCEPHTHMYRWYIAAFREEMNERERYLQTYESTFRPIVAELQIARDESLTGTLPSGVTYEPLDTKFAEDDSYSPAVFQLTFPGGESFACKLADPLDADNILFLSELAEEVEAHIRTPGNKYLTDLVAYTLTEQVVITTVMPGKNAKQRFDAGELRLTNELLKRLIDSVKELASFGVMVDGTDTNLMIADDGSIGWVDVGIPTQVDQGSLAYSLSRLMETVDDLRIDDRGEPNKETLLRLIEAKEGAELAKAVQEILEQD